MVGAHAFPRNPCPDTRAMFSVSASLRQQARADCDRNIAAIRPLTPQLCPSAAG